MLFDGHLDRELSCAVTGASGYLGSHIIAGLESKGCRIVRLDRSPVKCLRPDQTSIVGDIRDERVLDKLLAETDVVVHLASYVHKETISKQDLSECFSINVAGTRKLIEAIERTGRRQYVIFISSVAVYGSTFSLIKEESPCKPATSYGQSKLQAELIVKDALKRGAMIGCILRPSMVIGPGAPGNLKRLINLMRLRIFPVIGSGANEKSLVQVDDLVAVMMRCLAEPEITNGRVYNVASDPALTVRQIGEALARGLGHSPLYLPINDCMARLAAGSTRGISRLTGRRLPDMSRIIETFCSTATVDNSKIKQELDFRFQTPIDALAEVARETCRV